MNPSPLRLLTALALLAPAPASAVGLPRFDLDTGSFLRGAAAVPAMPVAGVPLESRLRAKGREYAEHLRRSGHLAAATAFHPVTDPEHAESPAYVMHDFPRGVCDVFIGDAAMEKAGFAGDFMLRFVMYHELAHCHLYAAPRDIKPFPELGAKANLMLSDFVHLEFFRSNDGDGFKANGYNTYHETYADIKAVGILLSEGFSREQVLEVVRFRERGSFSHMDTHDNAEVFAQVLDKPWASYGPERLDAEARAIADAYIRKNVFAKLYGPHVWQYTPFVEVLAGSVSQPAGNLRYPGTLPDVRASVERQTAQGAAAPNPVWRLYAGLARGSLDEPGVVDAFFRARYGAPKDGLAAEDKAIREALRAVSQ